MLFPENVLIVFHDKFPHPLQTSWKLSETKFFFLISLHDKTFFNVTDDTISTVIISHNVADVFLLPTFHSIACL
jgi:hypothetical protein